MENIGIYDMETELKNNIELYYEAIKTDQYDTIFNDLTSEKFIEMFFENNIKNRFSFNETNKINCLKILLTQYDIIYNKHLEDTSILKIFDGKQKRFLLKILFNILKEVGIETIISEDEWNEHSISFIRNSLIPLYNFFVMGCQKNFIDYVSLKILMEKDLIFKKLHLEISSIYFTKNLQNEVNNSSNDFLYKKVLAIVQDIDNVINFVNDEIKEMDSLSFFKDFISKIDESLSTDIIKNLFVGSKNKIFFFNDKFNKDFFKDYYKVNSIREDLNIKIINKINSIKF